MESVLYFNQYLCILCGGAHNLLHALSDQSKYYSLINKV
jgi:hypothetical protein